MKDQFTFRIENKEFRVNLDLLKGDFFVVQSVLGHYRVVWKEKMVETENMIKKLAKENKKNLLLVDKKIYSLYKKSFKGINKDNICLVRADEEFKTLKGTMRVINFLIKKGLTKGEKLIVLGGGTIQDVGAFVSAVYKRGIEWVFCPTTLLSMCDSCIGAKACINYQGAKNQLGLFSAPSQIIINPNFLNTLTTYDLKSGLGEMVKLYILGGQEILENYTSLVKNGRVLDFSSYKKLILYSLAIKKVVIEVDEFDQIYRKGLNYGHTIGHAIEILSNYTISHGQAVVIGMLVVNELSKRRNLLSEEENEKIKEILFELIDGGIKEKLNKVSLQELGQVLKKDKKTLGNLINFVILRSIGDTIFLPQKLNSELTEEISNIIRNISYEL